MPQQPDPGRAVHVNGSIQRETLTLPALSPLAGRLLDLPGLSQTLRAHLRPAYRWPATTLFSGQQTSTTAPISTRQALPTSRPGSRRSRPRRWPQSRLTHRHNENKLLVTTHITV